MRVIVTDYNPLWPSMFEVEANQRDILRFATFFVSMRMTQKSMVN